MSTEHERFCDRLKLAMRGQSGRSLALKSNMSPTGVAKYINGESTPNVERLIALAEALDVSVQWLATGVGQKSFVDKRTGKMLVESEPADYNKAVVDPNELVFKKAEVPKGILSGKASRAIDLMIDHGLFKPDCRVPTNAFIHVYNDAVESGLTDHSITVSILKTSIEQHEMSLSVVESIAKKGGDTAENIQPSIDSLKTTIAELKIELELATNGIVEIEGKADFSF